MKVEDQDGNKHQHASSHGKEEELDGCIDPSLGISPDADEKVHGDEHHFPEDIEEDEIEGDQGTDHSCFQEEKGDHEFLHPEGNGLPGAQDAEDGQKGGQEDQEQADSIDAQLVADPIGSGSTTNPPRIASLRSWG